MKLILRTLTVVALVGLTTVWLWAEQEPSLDVIVTYESGEVNVSNVIVATIFDNPTFQGEPLDMQIVTENGATASFSNVTTSPVYVGVIYLAGGFGGFSDATSIPSGTPVASLLNESFAPKALELTEGETVTVELSFTDAFRAP